MVGTEFREYQVQEGFTDYTGSCWWSTLLITYDYSYALSYLNKQEENLEENFSHIPRDKRLTKYRVISSLVRMETGE